MSYNQPPAYQPPSQPSQPEYNAGGEPPIWAPWYGIGFGAAIRRFFTKYADFTGRASRSEYWWWTLAYVIVLIVLNAISRAVGGAGTMNANGTMASPTAGAIVLGVIQLLFGLAIIIPTLALTWRRLHDTNRSGGWWFLIFIPIVGWIIVLVFTLLGSDPQGQRFDRPRA